QRSALVDDFLEQLHVHHALTPVHLVARTEDALGIAEVRALDLHDVGQPACAVAASGQEQSADGLRVAGEQALGDGSGVSRYCHRSVRTIISGYGRVPFGRPRLAAGSSVLRMCATTRSRIPSRSIVGR